MKHWIKIVFFCGALLLIPVLTLLKEPAAASYYENRSLAVFPPFSMQEMLDGGTTLLYVSHDVESVRRLCSHAIWLDHGHVQMSGPAEEVTEKYINNR